MMTTQQQEQIDRLAAELGTSPEVADFVTGAKTVYFSGRVGGIFWSREYRVAEDGEVTELASRP